jgi:hypothetical protein
MRLPGAWGGRQAGNVMPARDGPVDGIDMLPGTGIERRGHPEGFAMGRVEVGNLGRAIRVKKMVNMFPRGLKPKIAALALLFESVVGGGGHKGKDVRGGRLIRGWEKLLKKFLPEIHGVR